MTNNDRWAEAEILAARPYSLEVRSELTTDGQRIYVAMNPELVGCQSQGMTPDEAIQNLDEARVDFIYFLLEDGLPVPEPASILVAAPPSIQVQQAAESQAEVTQQNDSSTKTTARIVK